MLSPRRLLPSTVIKWGLSQWRTRAWRLEVERWCVMLLNRIRYVLPQDHCLVYHISHNITYQAYAKQVFFFNPSSLLPPQIIFVFQSPLNPGNEGLFMHFEIYI